MRLQGEIVEQIITGERNEFPAVRFVPATGKELIKFSATCGGVPDERVAEGDLLFEPLSECSNIEEVDFLFRPIVEVNTTGGKVKTPTTMEGASFSYSGSTYFFLPNFDKWGIC